MTSPKVIGNSFLCDGESKIWLLLKVKVIMGKGVMVTMLPKMALNNLWMLNFVFLHPLAPTLLLPSDRSFLLLLEEDSGHSKPS